MNISENIERYYHKARSSETRIKENRNRNRELRERFREWNRYYGIFQEIDNYRDLKAWKKKFADILPPADNTSREIGERRPYYEHVTVDKWRIWVGRSAKDNDEMTFKYAAKNDIWLHARNSTGSHVIIKKDGKKEVPGHIIGLAASLAARNSEEKHSSLVPVVYTERKYVSKRKGFPPGKVHFQFEKDIMVKPAELK
ncbi:MAG: NFACT RNA binding domain-containing protein [Candidatus Marinimicrobia bacterium]|nr:NFACT RNA binding domain-containing protein [Candidatus Neomarinimicrobiota bacterium]